MAVDRLVHGGINDSPRIDKLIELAGWLGEVFFRRLLHEADGFGNIDARASYIRSHCFPTLLERIREADVPRLLKYCEKAGLVRLYAVDGNEFAHIPRFRQRLRTMNRQVPASPYESDASQTQVRPESAEGKGEEVKGNRSARAHSGGAKPETAKQVAERVVGGKS